MWGVEETGYPAWSQWARALVALALAQNRGVAAPRGFDFLAPHSASAPPGNTQENSCELNCATNCDQEINRSRQIRAVPSCATGTKKWEGKKKGMIFTRNESDADYPKRTYTWLEYGSNPGALFFFFTCFLIIHPLENIFNFENEILKILWMCIYILDGLLSCLCTKINSLFFDAPPY